MRKKFVVGLVFDFTRRHVLLIRKNRPDSMAGKFNGIGGKVEPGEMFMDAMEREAEEEAGLSNLIWTPVVHIQGDDYQVQFFYAVMPGAIAYCQKTDEELFVCNLDTWSDLGYEMIEPLPWVIDCCYYKMGGPL